jgi:hypothetical protein
MDANTLTAADITALLAGTRTRGAVADRLRQFAASDELAVDLMTEAQFSQKKVDSLYNSVNQNLKTIRSENQDFPNLKVVKREDSLFVINVDKYTVAVAEGDTEAEAQ